MAQQTTQFRETTILSGKRFYVLVFLFTMFVINFVDRINLSVAAPAIAKEFHLDPVQMGWLFSAFLFTYVGCLIPSGWLIDRLGTRLVSSLAISIWSLAAMATGAVSTFGTMIVARLGLGLGESPGVPVCAKVVRQWFPAKERGLATTVFHAGTYCGPAVASPIVAWLVLTLGWRWSFVICGAAGFIWLAFWLKFFRLPEEATWLPESERRFILETRDGGATAPPAPSQATPQSGAGTVLGTLLSQKTMWGLALAQGCGNYTSYLFLSWLPTYLVQVRHMQLMKAGFLSGVPFLVALVLATAFGKLSDSILSPDGVKQGKRRNAVGTFLMLSSVVLLINAVNGEAAILTLISLSLTCNLTVLGLNVALTNDLIDDPRIAGTVFSIVLVGGNFFGLVAPIVTGYLVKATGSFASAFALAGTLVIVGAVIAFTMTRARIYGPGMLAAQKEASGL